MVRNRVVAAVMKMPELDRTLETMHRLLRGCFDGPPWTYEDGDAVDAVTFDACIGTLRDAFVRARRLMDLDRD